MNSFGAFDQCMIENDGYKRDGRRKRGLGWVLSLSLQTSLLAALVILPLMTPAALPKLFSVVPVPAAPVLRPVVVQEEAARSEPLEDRAYARPLLSRAAPAPRLQSSPAEPIADNLSILVATSANLSDVIGPPHAQIPEPAQPRVTASGPVQRGGTVMEAMLVNRVEPAYPGAARVLGLSGKVILSAVIASDGSIRSLRVVSGHPILAQGGRRRRPKVAL